MNKGLKDSQSRYKVCNRKRQEQHHISSQREHHEFTEGAFRDWGYDIAKTEFGASEIDGGWCSFPNPNTGNEIIVKDVIADAMLQQILTRLRIRGTGYYESEW